jgi:hypothetical protein
MKSGSAAAGALSGCTVWLVLVAVLSMCLVPVACLFTLFTSSSDLAASVVGPMVCPAGTTAEIETATETYTTDDGFTREALGREIVCTDHSGVVLARPEPLPGWIWTGLWTVVALGLAGLLALVFAAPAGVMVGKLLGRTKN